MRKQQRYDKQTQQPVIYSGLNPQSIVTSPGTIPNNNWTDYTPYIKGLYGLQLTFTEELDANNNRQQLPYNNQKKTASNTLSFERDAYDFIKAWLIDDVAAPLNAIEVKIVYSECVVFEDWSIEYQQITWCEDGLCEYNLTLKQKDPLYQCIQNTLINDNWQGWFQTVPSNGKKHPRFSYCNEIRPNATLVMQWWMTGIVAGSTIMVLIPLVLLLNSIFFAINGIIAIINAIASILGSGTSTTVNYIPFIDPFAILDSYTQYYVESAGCGREHPAPLVRDYITNVCDKCNILVDENSFPLFFATTLTIDTSDRGVITMDNPYRNVCYLNAPSKRGIRRFYNINIFGSPQPNNSDFWIEGNAPDIALSDLLDRLAMHFNSEWKLRSGKLHFQRKDFFTNSSPVYDFSENAPDREKIIEGICYEFNKVNYPAYVDGIYLDDSTDSCGNEARKPMNGKATSFTAYENQPNFEGKLQRDSVFGATKFRLDGASTDYIYDAMQVVLNGQILQPWTFGQMTTVASWLENYADYALLLRDETCALPKLLAWDGVAYENAKCVRNKSGYQPNSATSLPMPDPNPKYNLAPETWKQRYPPQTFVIGSSLTFTASPSGIYRVEDYFGNDVTEQPALLVNYPLYFEPYFYDTLWDLFHWIDDPRLNPTLNKRFNLKMRLCCDDIFRLGLENDNSNIQLGQPVIVPASQYYNRGKMTELIVSFDPSDRVGLYIEIKGRV